MVTETKLQQRLKALDNELNAVSDECSYHINISSANDGAVMNRSCRQVRLYCQGSICAEVERLVYRLPSRNVSPILTHDTREYLFEIMVTGHNGSPAFIASFFTRGSLGDGFSPRATNYRFTNAVSNLKKALGIDDNVSVSDEAVVSNKKVTMSLPKGATFISAVIVYKDKDGNYITDVQEPV